MLRDIALGDNIMKIIRKRCKTNGKLNYSYDLLGDNIMLAPHRAMRSAGAPKYRESLDIRLRKRRAKSVYPYIGIYGMGMLTEINIKTRPV